MRSKTTTRRGMTAALAAAFVAAVVGPTPTYAQPPVGRTESTAIDATSAVDTLPGSNVGSNAGSNAPVPRDRTRDADLDPGNGSAIIKVETPSGEIVELPAEVALDNTVEVTNEGVLITEPAQSGPFLHESGQPPPSQATSSRSPAAGDAFTLHSKPGADLVIYLDFDGHTTTGTEWNARQCTPSEFTSAIYSIDGDDAFSTAELEYIGLAWEMVAEDFAPFNVDVTTEDPGNDAIRRDNALDTQYGTRVVIAANNWYTNATPPCDVRNSGGVAYINSFTWNGSDAPSFVFTDALANGYWKFVGEAAAHEAGHTLGLYHDGTSTSSYYSGHGAGADGWAPIMGSGYYKPVTQWSKGDYAGATEFQDDVDILNTKLPESLIGGGGAPTVVAYDESVSGIIDSAGGVAEFDVTVGAGVASFTVTPTQPRSNLLAEMEVFRGADLVAQSSASSASGWTLNVNEDLSADTYRIRITGVGWLNAVTGFTDYASLGSFDLVVDAANPTPGSTTTTTAPPITTTTTTTAPPATTTTTTTTVAPPPPPPTTLAPPPPPPPPTTLAPPPAPAPSGDRLTAIAPVRLVDTRSGLGGSLRLDAGDTMRLIVTSHPSIPAESSAAVLNVVAVSPSAGGYLEVTPCSDPSPDQRTATVNFGAGSTVANSTIATLDAGGAVCIYAHVATDIVVDATGWLGATGEGALRVRVAERVVDSRLALGVSSRLRAGETRRVDIGNSVPDGAQAVSINLTAVAPAAGGYISAFPCSQGEAPTASVNYGPDQTRGNNAIVALDDDESFCLHSSAAADVVIDLTGHFEEAGLTFIGATPSRLLDTRNGANRLAAGSSVSFQIPPAPGGATTAAASVAITSVDQFVEGYATSWHCGPRPVTAAVTAVAFEANTNGAVASLSPTGQSCLYTNTDANLVVDFNGWWV